MFKVVLTIESVGEILQCDYSNEQREWDCPVVVMLITI